MLKKGFSNTDNKYVLFFKKRPLIKKKKDSIFKNNIDSIEKNNISTTKKLNQIIINLPNKKQYLRKQFLFDNNYQNDIFQTKIKDLIKKNQSIEKKQIIQKVERLDGIRESIKRLIQYKKKFAIDEDIVKLKIKENKKTPPICVYNPNLDSISKHVPVPDLLGHHHINLVKIKQQEEKKQIKHANNISDIEEFDENYDININNKKTSNNIISIKSYNYKKSNLQNLNNKQLYYNSLNSIDNNSKYNILPKSRSQSMSMDSAPLKKRKIRNNISVPIFNKMLSRDRNNHS